MYLPRNDFFPFSLTFQPTLCANKWVSTKKKRRFAGKNCIIISKKFSSKIVENILTVLSEPGSPCRDEARALIGGRTCVYSYIQVLPGLISFNYKVDFKRNYGRAEHMNIHLPHITALALPLRKPVLDNKTNSGNIESLNSLHATLHVC